MRIQTKRLTLIPLTAQQLKLLVDDTKAFEDQQQMTYAGEPLEGIFRNIINGQIQKIEQDPENILWYSFWLLVRTEDRTVVGAADFKNKPDEQGQVEIGYGLGKQHEKQGYMSEAVQAMCPWALEQPGITAVLAETYLDNTPSQNVLRRCGFQITSQTQSIWWRLEA